MGANIFISLMAASTDRVISRMKGKKKKNLYKPSMM